MYYFEIVCFTINESTVIKSVLIFMHENDFVIIGYTLRYPAGMTYAFFRHHRQTGVFFKMWKGLEVS